MKRSYWKNVLCTVIVLMMLVSITACAKVATTTTEEVVPKVELKIAFIFPNNSVNALTFEAYAAEVEKLSKGTIDVTLFPAGQLGTETEILEGVQQGTIDITMSGNGYGSFVPAFNAVGLPYLYKDSQSLLSFIKEGGGWKIIEELLAGSKFKPISFWILGAERSVLTKKPINSFADLKGLKIRTPEMNLFVQTFKAMGANPTPVAYAETYTAISSGVVDGCEMSPGYIYDAKFHEVAPNYTMTRHFVEYGVVTINEAKFKSLHPSQQKAILDAVPVMETYNQTNAPVANKTALEKMIKEGTVVKELSAAARQEFVDAVKPLYATYESNYGDLAKK